MQRLIRKFAWLTAASMVAVSLAIGAVVAHEGRPVGDYRFVVGWAEEPAYEGAHNAVSVRVNKIVEGEAMPDGQVKEGEATPEEEAEKEEHGPPGHHDEDPEGTPAVSNEERESSETQDHHGSQDQDSSGQHGAEPSATPGPSTTAGHHGSNEGDKDGMDGMSHGDSGHHGDSIEAASAMSVAVETSVDSVSGLNVQIIPDGFTFAANSVNGAHVDGEGHAHIYVDGEKITRVYTPWYYLGDIEPGEHEIRVTLNANSHEVYAYGGSPVDVTTVVDVPEPHGHTHAAETVEADSRMSVGIAQERDPLGGANLFVPTEGITFAPQNSGNHHVPSEGHGHVYVNGVKIGRIYGEAMQLGKLAAGIKKVRVTLNTNDHSVYTWNEKPVEATVTFEIEEGMGGPGHGDAPSGHHKPGDKPDGDTHTNSEQNHKGTTGEGMVEKETSRSVVPQGAAKPLASIAGQDEGVAVPVDGLEETLQVEVTHVATGVSRILDLEAAWGDPGHYVAGVIPTAAGVYEFRVFGTIEGMEIDETFVSSGGGGDFDDVQSSAELQFPEQLPEMREIVGAVQGARNIAQEAQDAALAAQAAGGTSGGGGGNALVLVALIVGIVGAVLGAGGVYFGLSARRSQ